MDRAPIREHRASCDRALDRYPDHRPQYPAQYRSRAQESARDIRPCHQLVEGARLMRPHTLYIVLLSSVGLTACATFRPPEISYDDDPKPAVFQGEPPRPVEVVEIPKPLPLPGQLKAVPGGKALGPEPKNPTDRVAKANDAARVQPTRNGYINAVQVYPYATGALYQVYTAPGQVTDIALQEGEQLVGSGPVAAGDTCAGSSATPKAGPGRRNASTSRSSQPARILSPIWSSTPTAVPITSSCAPPRRPTWPRSPGSTRRIS